MQFTANINELNIALAKIAVALENKSELEAFTRIALTIGPGCLSLGAMTSKLMAARTRVSIIGGPVLEETLCVPGRLLKDIVGVLAGDSVLFTMSSKDMSLEARGSAFIMPRYADDSYPVRQVSTDLDQKYPAIDLKELVRGLSKVVHNTAALTDNNSRVYSPGVCVDKEHFVATDGYRLGLYRNTCLKVDQPIVIPATAAQRLIKLFGGSAEGTAGADQGTFFVSDGVLDSSSRLMSIAYPRYSAAIPTGPCQTCTVDRRDLMAALKRVKIVAGREFTANLTLRGRKLTLATTDAKSSSATDDVEAMEEGEFTVLVNGQFLLDVAAALDQDTVAIEFRGQDKAVLIKEEGLCNVLMPKHPGSA